MQKMCYSQIDYYYSMKGKKTHYQAMGGSEYASKGVVNSIIQLTKINKHFGIA